MNIYIINQYATHMPFNQAGRHWFLAKELAKKGYKITLVTASWHHLFLGENLNGDKHISVHVVDEIQVVFIPVKYYSNARSRQRVINWFIFALSICRMKIFNENIPDVVIYSSPSLIGFLGAEYLARKYKSKLIFEVRDIWPLTLVELGGYSVLNPFIVFLQWIEDRAYKKAHGVISNLPYAYKHMISRGMPMEKFTWIPNGIVMTRFLLNQPLPTDITSHMPNNKFIVCYTGTIGLANAVDTLIDAALILRDNLDVIFFIVGSGSEENILRKRVTDLCLNNVIFTGEVSKEKIPGILDKANVCYVGLKKDKLFHFGVSPNKLFEYMLASKPVIYAIDSGDYRPVEVFEAGIQISAESPGELAQCILKLKEMSRDKLLLMGRNGYENVVKHHNYSTLAAKLVDIINQ